MAASKIVFWGCCALLVHAHVTYPLSLVALRRLLGHRRVPVPTSAGDTELPSVSLVVAAHDEEGVIDERVRNALAADYPRERLEVIVACDGCTDRTAQLAREAGADLVLELSRAGKVIAQNEAVRHARGEVLAFSDANSLWEPQALRRLVSRLADPDVAYVCGQVRFEGRGAANQEGAYWRYEMAVRELESELAGVTAGNGAIYATRRGDYLFLDSARGHDLCFPFELARRGRRSVYEPRALARERMAPTMSGEFERKRRMMNRTWGVLIADRMLSPRGYGATYAYEVLSHRALRYTSPFLHLAALAANLALARSGRVYATALAAQLGLLAAAAAAARWTARPLAVARYYVVVTASIAVGLWDRALGRRADTWTPVEGTR